MASVNKVIIVGNLGADPETRYLPSGEAVTNIRVATTDRWKDKQSQARSSTEIRGAVMQMLGRREGGGEPREPAMASKAAEPRGDAPGAKKPAGKFDDLEDDIPF